MPFDPDAYPTIPESEITPHPSAVPPGTPPPRAARFSVPTPTQQAQMSRVDNVLKEFQEHEARVLEETKVQHALMHEARVRFAKASLYEQILSGSVFEGSNDPITAEVNAEFREFAQEKLCALLGIETEATKKSPKLDDEQVEILAIVANRLLQRGAGTGAIDSKQESAPAAPKVGKLAPVQRSVTRVPRQERPKPNRLQAAPPVSPQNQPVRPSNIQQLALPLDPAVTAPNIKEIRRADGEVFQTNLAPQQVIPLQNVGGPKPLPMPSPDEQVAIAAYQGQRGLAASGVVARAVQNANTVAVENQ